MPLQRKAVTQPVDRTRFDVGSIVTWYEGLHERRGKVIRNFPGVGGQPAKILVRDAHGQDHTVKASQVMTRFGLTQQ